MKYFPILILLLLASFKVSATACYSNTGGSTPNTNCTIDCSNPNTSLNNGLQTCGYIDDPAETNPGYDTCYDYYNPTYSGFFTANGVVVSGCKYFTAAPVNSGLIFLILSGMFLGALAIYKGNTRIVS